MTSFKLAAFCAISLLPLGLLADDLLGEKRGGGSSGGTSVGSSNGSGNSGGRGNSNNGNGGGRVNSSSSGGSSSSSGIGRSSSSGVTRVESTSRSGRVSYGTNNNRVSSSRTQPSQPQRVQSFHSTSRGSIASQALSEDQVRRAYRGDQYVYRDGYHSYTRSWYDDRFCYPFYSFSFNPRTCVISPFYAYSHLPGYLHDNRVRFGSFWIDCAPLVTINLNWGRSAPRNSEFYGLTEALNDLERSFRRTDLRSLSDLIPRNGVVRIAGDYSGDYFVNSDDYYDMMRDLVSTTRTRDFRLLEVRQGRGQWYQSVNNIRRQGDFATVTVEHVFEDSWRRTNRVEMEFVLEEDRRGNYFIVQMSTFDSYNDGWDRYDDDRYRR